MKEDIQQRIRELAYLMWESGGKQADMANEYWLRAEREVMATLKKAATIVTPAASRVSPAEHGANRRCTSHRLVGSARRLARVR